MMAGVDLFSDPPESLPAEVVTARDGTPTIRLAGRFLHSSFNPAREARTLVEALHRRYGRDTAVVVVGLGLGYHLEELVLQGTAGPIVVAEAAPEVITAAREYRDEQWWRQFAPAALVPAWRYDLVIETLRTLGIRSFAVLVLQGEAQAARETVLALTDALDHYRRRTEINTHTLRRFGKVWVRNTLKNLSRAAAHRGVEELEGCAAGYPAVVCGAGPTWDDVAHELPALRDHAVIIAVDTAVAALHRMGFTPHVAVVADPQYWNTRHLDSVGVASGETILVAEPATHPRVFRLWRGPVFVSASLFPLGSFFDQRFQRRGKLGAGGSVATSAWDLARFMGCTSIYLAGVDLGFPGNRTHCSGSFFEERLMGNTTRCRPAEQGLYRYLHDANPRQVPSAGGAPVLSDQRMDIYRSWFGEQNRLNPGVTTCLLSPRGAAIPGCPVAEPRAALSAILREEATPEGSAPEGPSADRRCPAPPPGGPRELLHNVVSRSREAVPGIPRARAAVEHLHQQILLLKVIAHGGVVHCERLLTGDRITPDDLSVLDTVDDEIQRFPYREVAGFLAESAISAAVEQTASTPRQGVQQALEIYRALVESVEFHETLISRYTPPQ